MKRSTHAWSLRASSLLFWVKDSFRKPFHSQKPKLNETRVGKTPTRVSGNRWPFHWVDVRHASSTVRHIFILVNFRRWGWAFSTKHLSRDVVRQSQMNKKIFFSPHKSAFNLIAKRLWMEENKTKECVSTPLEKLWNNKIYKSFILPRSSPRNGLNQSFRQVRFEVGRADVFSKTVFIISLWD